jgi:hypothetical protein
MRTTTCDHIRRALDEIMLEESTSPVVEAHLRSCANCQEFDQKQRKLRQIVGSLGTVEAPSDFDFRLRARLASEPATGSYHFWPVLKWGSTAVAAGVLFFGGFTFVRQFTLPSTPSQSAQVKPPANPPNSPDSSSKSAPIGDATPAPPAGTATPELAGLNQPATSRTNKTNNRPRIRRTLEAQDFSGTGAPVIPVNTDAVFSVDAARPAFTFSLDDGRGNARTISLPTVTFGSQRVLGTANQYAPKGVW